MTKRLAYSILTTLAALGLAFGVTATASAQQKACLIETAPGSGTWIPCPPTITDSSNSGTSSGGGAAGAGNNPSGQQGYTPAPAPSGDSQWTISIDRDGKITGTTPFDKDDSSNEETTPSDNTSEESAAG